MSFRPSDQHGATIRLLVIAERLYDAIASRDVDLVQALLDSGAASSLPRQVREEALAVVALPAASRRVPMALLRYHHRLTELARSDHDPGEAFRALDAEVEIDVGDDFAAEGAIDVDDDFDAEAAIDAGDDRGASQQSDPAQMEIPFGGPRWDLRLGY